LARREADKLDRLLGLTVQDRPIKEVSVGTAGCSSIAGLLITTDRQEGFEKLGADAVPRAAPLDQPTS
jgi:hypothetical protein